VTFVDILIVLTVVAAVFHGLYLGAALQVTSFVGLWGGLALGASLAPTVSSLAKDPGAKVLLTLLTVFGTSVVLATLGQVVGERIWRSMARLHLGGLDKTLGAALAGGATLLAAWLVGSMLATVPAPAVAQSIQRSTVLRTLDRVLPPAPQIFARIDRLLDPLGFPRVFVGLEPAPAPSVGLPPDPVVRTAAQKAERSVVRIVAPGCGAVHTGSGWVAAPDLVVTNAHVVAGADRTIVQDRSGSHNASTVYFDPDHDVAVLNVRGLAGPPLSLLPSTAPRGTQGAVIGYPGGGPEKVVPASVLRSERALGRDIYGRSLVTRSIYELDADVRPGNSGGPMVQSDGAVVGVVFARSAYNPNLGFALTPEEVRPALDAAQARRPVDTGPCAA
jgi:S1-C subfamily serine protease